MRSFRAHFALAAVFVAGLFGTTLLAAQGTTSPYSDPAGDIDPSIASANGTADILGMEITSTDTDLIFKMTVNGNVPATDWAKFLIGIATYKTNGTVTGNGWARPINLSVTPTGAVSPIGMNYWIGSWADWGGGQNSFAYDGTQWNGASLVSAFSITPGATSDINFTVPMAGLGLAPGDTFSFDAYTTGGGNGDSAIDALANPNVSITSWGGPYTSQPLAFGGPGLNSYTIPIPEPSTTAMAIAAVAFGGFMLRRRMRRA